MNNQTNKHEFLSLLRSTQRENVETVITKLEELGFFEAPASTNFHLNVAGGLVQHSLNVCHVGMMLREQMIQMDASLAEKLSVESVIIATLLHDVCKAEIYKKVIKKRKNKTGAWEEYEGYDVDYNNFPLGHGEKSIIRLLQWGFPLTDDEIMAIRWHMHACEIPFQSYEAKGNYNAAKEKCPLVSLVQAADNLASSMLENSLTSLQYL